MAIFIDEVHHASTDEIKLRAVVNDWMESKRKIIPTLTRKHHFVGTNCTIGIRKTA